MPVYPQAALGTALVSWAYDHGRLPSEVYLDYLANPRDYLLLFAFSAFRADLQEQAQKKAERNSKNSR